VLRGVDDAAIDTATSANFASLFTP
jgi:hypothetical protein